MTLRRMLLTCVCAAALCSPAWAQDKVAIRTGLHDDYSRLVFDWGASVPYTVTQSSPTTLDVTFQKPAGIDVTGVDTTSASNIVAVEKISGDSENLKIKVTIPAGKTFRHFLVNDKVVLDVYGKIDTASATPAPALKDEPAKVPGPKPEPAPETPEIKMAEQPPVPAMPAASVDEKPPVTPTPIDIGATAIDPHTITISSTNTVGVAVFERHGDLWIVLDRSDLPVPPQIAGPQKDSFPPFRKVELTGASAYRTRIPDNVNIYGEGGGLIWRVIVTPEERDVNPAAPERSFVEGQSIRGGTMTWPLQRVTRIIELKDPDIGDTILVGTVNQASQFAGSARDFVDFATLDSPVGIAIVKKSDDLTVTPTGTGLQVTRQGGLAISRTRDVTQRMISDEIKAGDKENGADAAGAMKRIYDFDRWMMGGIQALRDNQQVILAGMANKDKVGRVQDLLMMAKMNLANDRGQEALGFLNFAETEMPEIKDSPEFLALRGASEALSGKFELAFDDLMTPALKEYGELNYWRAYTLAGLEDWQQAKDFMSVSFDVLNEYPRSIRERLGVKLTELSLRSGNKDAAETLLSSLEKERTLLKPWTVAGIDYLRGELDRQNGANAQAIELWAGLSKGKDDLYRAKSSLALTMLQLQDKEITRAEAIDRLEGLRYHWRGDELEAQTNFMLGKMYLEDKRYMKGFGILRDAVLMSPESDIGKEISKYMAQSFKDIFLSSKVNEMTPVDAVTVFEEFRDLTPPGSEGNSLVQRLAERLVDADLLARAAALLQNQVDVRLSGKEQADVALRLSAIYLLNEDPKPAIAALDKAAAGFAALEPKTEEITQKQKEIELLRARALSDLDKVEEALAILNKFPPSPEVNRLRADIAWNAGMWEDASEALQDLILDESIDLGRPITQKQADLILNRAVALNLSGNRVELSNMRTKYEAAMAKTSRAKMFDVVTRPRTGVLSSDRDSIAALVSEVDMFKEFLDSYRADNSPSN